jgi:hypothetical protein
MPTSTRSRPPKVGQRVTLEGKVTRIDDSLEGFERVSIKLDSYEYPITIIWGDRDTAAQNA